MATRLLTEAQYAAHQAKHGRTTLRDIAGPGAKAALERRSKFGNVKTVVDGVKLDSKREAKRYRELGLLLKAGEIDFLCRQPRFTLPGGIQYIGDFLYGKICPDQWICEDVKGMRTKEYNLKKKLMLSTHGIEIKET